MSALIERGGEVRLGSSDLISPGEGRSIRVDGQAIALFRGRTGDLYAVENRCPHRGGPLADGIFGGGQVICPYHSYRFDLATGACLTDATCSLRTFPVSERHGEILVTHHGRGVAKIVPHTEERETPYFSRRKLTPAFRKLAGSGRLRGAKDSAQGISEDREDRGL